MISDTDNTAGAPLALLFFVPDEDQGAYQALPAKVAHDVDRLLAALERIHSAPKRNPEILRQAALFDGARGLSFESLRRKYYSYTRTGNWRDLVDWTRVPPSSRPSAGTGRSDSEALPPDFLEHLKGLFQSNQRKSEPAIRLLYRQWRAGESIPGFGSWQEWFQATHPHHPLPHKCPPDLPRGWSKGNLRRYIPEDAELALSRRGVSAALQLLPDILITRSGLRPLEYIMFDDFRTDFKILVSGYPTPVELNGLVALDVATGRPLRYGLRPAIERADGAKDHLKLRDMKCLIAGVLLQYGVPRQYPMHLIVENATATVRDTFAAALDELAKSLRPRSSSDQGYAIHVHRTQMICGTAIWAGFRDRSTGNPQGKGALESTFNLWHNEAAFLPGQTGSRYDSGPMELAGRTQESVALTRTARHLSPFQRAKLKMPFLNYSQARLVMTDLWDRLAQRTDHSMEAFDLISEWREREFDQWRPDHELPLVFPNGVPPHVLWRNPPRKESPMERWARLVDLAGGAAAYARPHPAAVARLYDEHKLAVVTQYQIAFQYDKDSCYFRLANLVRGTRPIKNGEKVLCYFDPQDLSWVHLTDGQGAYLGSIERTRGVKRTDTAALKAEFDRKRQQLHDLQEVVSSRMPEQAEQRLADLHDNIEVLAGAVQDSGALQAVAADADAAGAAYSTAIADARERHQLSPRKVASQLKQHPGDIADLAAPAPDAADSSTDDAPVSDLVHAGFHAPEDPLQTSDLSTEDLL